MRLTRPVGEAYKREEANHRENLKQDYWESIKIVDVDFQEISSRILSDEENKQIRRTVTSRKIIVWG